MGEMMNWVKTFIGRIVALEGDDQLHRPLMTTSAYGGDLRGEA